MNMRLIKKYFFLVAVTLVFTLFIGNTSQLGINIGTFNKIVGTADFNVLAGESKVTTANLNLRTGPGTSYPVIAVIPKGTLVNVSSYSGTWAKITYSGKTGYSSSSYLAVSSGTSTSPAEPTSNEAAIYVTTANLNFRTGPGTNYSIILTIPNGTKVSVLSSSNGWANINYNGKLGYSSTSYLALSSVPSKLPVTSTPNETAIYVTTANLNFRTGPGTNYSIILTIPNGTKVSVLSSSNGWANINYNGKSGYSSTSYLTAVNTALPAPISESEPKPSPDTFIASVNNMLVSYSSGTLRLSKDNGVTVTNSLPIPNVSIIKFFHLFANGNIIFADHTKVYYSDDWTSYHQSTVLDVNGNPFNPANFDNFTSYFNNAVKSVVNGKEIKVWGNYSIADGVQYSDKIRVWYTVDYGRTVKECYSFNLPNSLPARHIHNVDFNPYDNTFWIQTGDEPLNSQDMAHWVKGTYDFSNDKWSWSEFKSGLNFKSINMIFNADGYVYFSWDKTPGGVVRAPYETLDDPLTHEVLFTTSKDCAGILIGPRGDIVAFQLEFNGVGMPRVFYYSPDQKNFYSITGEIPLKYDSSYNAQYVNIWAPNSQGRILAGVTGDWTDIVDWGKTPSVFIDDFIRNAGFPNALKP